VEEVGDHVGSQEVEFLVGFQECTSQAAYGLLSWSIRSLCCNPAHAVMYPPRYQSASAAAEGIISPPLTLNHILLQDIGSSVVYKKNTLTQQI